MDFKYGIPFGGAIGNMFDSFFHPEKGYKDFEDTIKKYWDEAQKHQKPIEDQGQAQYPKLSAAEDSLLDPETLLNKWMQNYKTSDYAKQSLGNAQTAGLGAASSQGLLGSSAATQNIQNSASDIMNKDRTEYLKDLMDKYKTGIGIGQDIYGKGADASKNLGQQANDVGKEVGGAKYGEDNSPGNLLEHIMNMITNIISGKNGGAFGGASGGATSSISG